MKRTPAATRQREDPLGDPSGAPTNVRVLVPLPRRLDPEPFSHVRRRLVGRDLQPPLPEAEPAIVELAVKGERIAPPRIANETTLALFVLVFLEFVLLLFIILFVVDVILFVAIFFLCFLSIL